MMMPAAVVSTLMPAVMPAMMASSVIIGIRTVHRVASGITVGIVVLWLAGFILRLELVLESSQGTIAQAYDSTSTAARRRQVDAGSR
jgi:hypothetical protein